MWSIADGGSQTVVTDGENKHKYEKCALRLMIVVCMVVLVISISNQKNIQAVKYGAASKKARVKKDVKSKVVAKKWL